MAKTIDAGPDIKRDDLFLIDPFEIEVREELRGRYKPPTEEDVIDLALSLLQDGQRQPVECRRVAGNRLMLVMGFTRMAAIRLIREGFDYEDQHYQDPEFRIKTLVVDCDEKAAVRRNIVENRHRNETSPIDDAFNMDRLTDRYGYDDSEIATLYRLSVAQVQRVKQLVRLPEELRDKVHTRALSVEAAMALEMVPQAKQAEILTSAVTPNGRIDGAEVKRQVRDRILRDEGPQCPQCNVEMVKADKGFACPACGLTVAPKVEPKAIPTRLIRRSLKEVRDFLQGYRVVDGRQGDLSRALLDYMDGRTSDEQLRRVWTEEVSA